MTIVIQDTFATETAVFKKSNAKEPHNVQAHRCCIIVTPGVASVFLTNHHQLEIQTVDSLDCRPAGSLMKMTRAQRVHFLFENSPSKVLKRRENQRNGRAKQGENLISGIEIGKGNEEEGVKEKVNLNIFHKKIHEIHRAPLPIMFLDALSSSFSWKGIIKTVLVSARVSGFEWKILSTMTFCELFSFFIEKYSGN